MFQLAGIVIILLFDILASGDVVCYRCYNGQSCMKPSVENTRQEFCLDDDICSTYTIFARSNSTLPYESEATAVERRCINRHSFLCTKENSCIKKDNFLQCYSCCDSPRCNVDLPGYSTGIRNSKSSLLLVFTSIFLTWVMFVMT